MKRIAFKNWNLYKFGSTVWEDKNERKLVMEPIFIIQ